MSAPALWRSRPDTRFALAALALVTVLVAVSASMLDSGRSIALELGITVDLTLGLPLLAYLFLVRSGRVTAGSLLPLGLAGLALSRLVISGPEAVRNLSWDFTLLAVASVALVLVLLWAGRVGARYSERRDTAPHRADAMRLAFAEGLGPRLGSIAFGEAAVVWYALTGWGRGQSPARGAVDMLPPGGHAAVVGALSLLLVVETFAVHLLLHLWDPRVAWLLTLSSIYAVLWLLGDLHASRLVPTRLDRGGLHLRAGLRWRMDVEWDQVAEIHSAPPNAEALPTTFLRGPDLWIEFHAPQEVAGPMGITKRTSTVGIALGDPAEFRRQCAIFADRGSPDASR